MALAVMPRRGYDQMSLKNLALILASALPFAFAPGCTSDTTSSTKQMISCDATTGTNCTPVESDNGDPNTCIDIDEDGDGEADDANEGPDDNAHATGDTDDDNDGIADSEDPDDDNDGVPDTRDCDERAGGQDDDAGDAP